MTPPAGTHTLPRTVAPRAPRRVSGPAPRTRRGEDRRPGAAARTRARAASDPLGVRALRRTRQLADSRFLDRLIRGRLWIPLVAAGLMGIVFMQVTMLKFNAGIGRAVTSATTLERQNSTLRADVSRMEAGSRIDAVAHDLGMVVPADGSTSYVTAAGATQARSAAARMTPADPNAIARAEAGTALAQGQAAGTTTTGSATAAPTPAEAQAAQMQTQAQTGAVAAAPASTSTTSGTTGSAGTAATGTTASTPPPAAATQQPTATATPTGATAAPTQQSPAPAQTAAAPQTQQTSGGAVAPTPQG
ncbi:MAG TPA: hypothetical protein VI318_07675 [Baekduia sp.]